MNLVTLMIIGQSKINITENNIRKNGYFLIYIHSFLWFFILYVKVIIEPERIF